MKAFTTSAGKYVLIGTGIMTTGLIASYSSASKEAKKIKPNFIIIYTDDQGFDYYYGTLGANDKGVVNLSSFLQSPGKR